MSEDLPIQSKGCYGFSDEQIDQHSEIEETGPLESRINSKNWKTRSTAYSELIHELGSIKSYSSHESKLLKLLSDSNPNPQEKSLEILSLFLKNEPNLVSPYLGGILKILIEKNISGSKQSAKDSAKALVTGLFKLDRAQVTGVLIKYLDHKTPKMVSAAIVSFTVVLENLSFKVLDLNLVTSQMAKTSEHTNPQIRSESLNWFKELYKQIQSGIEPFLSKLKKPQQEELRKLFTTIEVLPSTGIDCSEMLESRDIFQKFNEKWTETVLSLEKWTEKKQALEELNTAADYPKLSEKSASYLVAMCKRLLNDSNIHVVSQSIKLLGLLAKGQKRFFESFAKMMAPVLFLKFRDKNKIIIQETHLALENFLFAVSLDQLLPMLESSLNDKTIPVKLQTLTFINKVFRKASKEGIRELFMLLIIISDDSNDTVREACFNVLAVFVNEFLELLSLLSELPEVKKKKVNFIRNQLTSAGQNKENLNVEVKVKNFETTMDLDRPLQRKKELHEKKNCEKEENIEKNLEYKTFKSLDSGITAKLKDKNWKVREIGLKELKTKAEDSEGTENLIEIHENVFETLSAFKENNLNLIKAGLECLLIVYQKTVIPADLVQKLFSNQCLEKLAEAKSSELLKNCLMNVSEFLGPNEMVLKFSLYVKESPKLKVLTESCELLALSVKEFNFNLFDKKLLVDYAKSCVQHTNPSVKKSAYGLFKRIYSKIGCSVYEMIDDLKESTLRLLKDEFLSVEADTVPEIRKMRVVIKQNPGSLIKKQNISSQITSDLLSQLESKDWQLKKKALESLNQIIPKKLSSAGLSDLIRILKASLSDSNKISVRLTLEVLDKLALALDEECSGFYRPVINSIIFLFKDKTSNIRTTAKDSIDIWASKVGQEKILNALIEPLKWDSLESRTEILNYIVKNKSFLSKCDIKSMIPNILLCLQDRTISVRNQAEVVFGEIVEITGFDPVQHHLECMKPAVLQSLKPILDKYRGPVRVGAHCIKVASKYSPKYSFFIPNKKSRVDVQDWVKIPEKTAEFVKNELKICSSPELFELLYNQEVSFKKSVNTAFEGMIENQNFSDTFDIVLKWVLIELYQNNPTSVSVAVNCIEIILSYYKKMSLKPPDGELDIVIPALAVKSVESASACYCRSTLLNVFSIYHGEKAYNSLIIGLNAKNTLKFETLNLLKEIYNNCENDVSLKVVKFLENLTKAKEGKVADEAFDLLSVIYRKQGNLVMDNIEKALMLKLQQIVKKDNKVNQVPVLKQEISDNPSSFHNLVLIIISLLKQKNIQECFEGIKLLKNYLSQSFQDIKDFSDTQRDELIEALLQFLNNLFNVKEINDIDFKFKLLNPKEINDTLCVINDLFLKSNILAGLRYSQYKEIFVFFINIRINSDVFSIASGEIIEVLKTLFSKTDPNIVIKLLFQLLTLEDDIEFNGVVTKCICRYSLILENLIFDPCLALLSLHEAIHTITSNMGEFFNENDTRLKAIKLFLMELFFATGESIFELYEQTIRFHQDEDKNIEDWLKVIHEGNYQVLMMFKNIEQGGNIEKCADDIHKLMADNKQVSLDYFFKNYPKIAYTVDEILQNKYKRRPSRYNSSLTKPLD